MKKVLFFAFCFGAATASAQAPNNTLKSVVDSFRVAYQIPAVAASVITPDTILFGLSGSKKIESQEEVEHKSLFHLASNTKAITATLAAKLVEAGKVSWTDKLVDVIPELDGVVKPDYRDVTLEQFLAHQGKVRPFEDDGSKEWKNMPKTISNAENQRLEFAKYALSLPPIKAKKSGVPYSNGGYIVATAMLEAASGKSWEALVGELFDELGLEYFIGFPSQKSAQETFGHQKTRRSYKSIPPEKEYPLEKFFAPTGNLSMSVHDFSKFIQLHLQGLLGNDNFLQPQTFQKLHFGFSGYALGWYLSLIHI